MFITRELVGVYELLTTPFPIPAGFKPILSPDYPWSSRGNQAVRERPANPGPNLPQILCTLLWISGWKGRRAPGCRELPQAG